MSHLSQTQIDFRNAMSRLPAAVNIITSDGPGGRCGITASAVCSVTDSPPTVLVCIERSSRTLASIVASGIFCVNTLPAHEVELAEIFASRRGITGEGRFATAEWDSLATGAPALRTALAAFDGRLVATHDIASHRVLIGEVVALGGQGKGGTLLYRRRHFEAL